MPATTVTLESALAMGIPIELTADKFCANYEVLPPSVHPTPFSHGEYAVNSSGVQGARSVGGRVEPHSHSGRVDHYPRWRFGTPSRDSSLRCFETSRANTPKFLCDEVFEPLVKYMEFGL